jgi:hypothetical protein
LLSKRNKRKARRRTSKNCDEFPSSHQRPQRSDRGMVTTIRSGPK